MPDSEDISLLKRYADGDEPAFTLLVERYIHLVYSTALRQVGNPSHAEEISQAVFIILTRKAKSIGPKTILSGWLYQTARLTAANFLRSESSRQKREQEAYMQSTLTAQDIESWNEIAPLLEEAMGRLGQTDRDVIVLRFFENKTPQELATMMGLNEVTARKRVNRALERLRNYFSKRGVDSTTSAIAKTISGNAVQFAPVGLAKSVTTAALTKGAAASTLTLVKGALKIMAWTKVKSVAVISIGMLLVAGTATVVEKVSQPHELSGSVAVLFLSYTNGGGERFVMLKFVNGEKKTIHWRDILVEEKGSTVLYAPVMNMNLPWITKNSLKSGDSEVLAVTAEQPSTMWRVRWDYVMAGSTNIYSARSSWFEPSSAIR